jgi:hypothetical protein
MLKQIMLILATLVNFSLQTGTEFYMRPIMYGTSIGLVLIAFFVVAWIFGMTYEKDPLIYSKFLSVRKNK